MNKNKALNENTKNKNSKKDIFKLKNIKKKVNEISISSKELKQPVLNKRYDTDLNISNKNNNKSESENKIKTKKIMKLVDIKKKIIKFLKSLANKLILIMII